MKVKILQLALVMFVLSVTACSEQDDENEAEVQSFSSYVRDVFEESENEKPESVIEGVDFQFEDADQLETYSDLLVR